jgi:hypothetical protein
VIREDWLMISQTRAQIQCPKCNGTGTLPRPQGVTMDGLPCGDVIITRAELFPAICDRCSGSGEVPGKAPTEG